LDKSACFRFIKPTFHITAAELVGRVELEYEILPKVETCRAIAAEPGNDGFREAFDLQFYSLDQSGCFAKQVFSWFFLARPHRHKFCNSLICNFPLGELNLPPSLFPTDRTAAKAICRANRPRRISSRLPRPRACRSGNDIRR